jgi:hypothetical protein
MLEKVGVGDIEAALVEAGVLLAGAAAFGLACDSHAAAAQTMSATTTRTTAVLKRPYAPPTISASGITLRARR